MENPLQNVCRGSLPAASLAALAGLRCHPGVTVSFVGDRAWLRWPDGDEEVLRQVLAVSGVELYEHHDGFWHRHGQALPAFDLPAEGEPLPLFRVLVPAPVEAEATPDRPGPVPLRLVRDDRPRPTSALWCAAPDLGPWADRAPQAELGAVRAARCGDDVLLVGSRLPPLPGVRLWGGRVLVPLGFRPEPALPDGALREALRVAADEVAVLGEEGVDVVPDEALVPLTRAGVRLALGEGG
jgi:hypothetical protein